MSQTGTETETERRHTPFGLLTILEALVAILLNVSVLTNKELPLILAIAFWSPVLVVILANVFHAPSAPSWLRWLCVFLFVWNLESVGVVLLGVALFPQFVFASTIIGGSASVLTVAVMALFVDWVKRYLKE